MENTGNSSSAKGENITFASEILSELRKNSKRWFIAFIVTLLFLAGTNMAWLYVFQSYDYVTVDSDNSGNANYIGNDGDITNNG